MQRDDLSHRNTPSWQIVMVWISLLSVLTGTGQQAVCAAAESAKSPLEVVREERFLQKFISNALQPESSLQPKKTVTPQDPISNNPEVQTSSPGRLLTTEYEQPTYGTATVKMVLALGLTLALLGICGYVVKRYLHKPGLLGKREASLRLLSRISITPKASVALLEIPGKWLVIGITGSTLSALGEIPVPEADPNDVSQSNRVASFDETLQEQVQHSRRHLSSDDDPFLQAPERIQRKVSSLKQL